MIIWNSESPWRIWLDSWTIHCTRLMVWIRLWNLLFSGVSAHRSLDPGVRPSEVLALRSLDLGVRPLEVSTLEFGPRKSRPLEFGPRKSRSSEFGPRKSRPSEFGPRKSWPSEDSTLRSLDPQSSASRESSEVGISALGVLVSESRSSLVRWFVLITQIRGWCLLEPNRLADLQSWLEWSKFSGIAKLRVCGIWEHGPHGKPSQNPHWFICFHVSEKIFSRDSSLKITFVPVHFPCCCGPFDLHDWWSAFIDSAGGVVWRFVSMEGCRSVCLASPILRILALDTTKPKTDLDKVTGPRVNLVPPNLSQFTLLLIPDMTHN